VYRGDTLEGYLYYHQKDREGGYHLFLTDLAFLTADAGRRLLGLLGDHSSMTGEVRWMGGPADAITQLLPELNYEIGFRMHWMTRITHVEAALAGRGYSPAVAAKLHLEITDDVVPANTGRYVLGVTGGAAMVEPGGRGELKLHVRALAALYTGFQSADALRLTGRLTGPDEAVAVANGVFAGPPPSMPDMF
jgi:predicted acetyltransferase